MHNSDGVLSDLSNNNQPGASLWLESRGSDIVTQETEEKGASVLSISDLETIPLDATAYSYESPPLKINEASLSVGLLSSDRKSFVKSLAADFLFYANVLQMVEAIGFEIARLSGFSAVTDDELDPLRVMVLSVLFPDLLALMATVVTYMGGSQCCKFAKSYRYAKEEKQSQVLAGGLVAYAAVVIPDVVLTCLKKRLPVSLRLTEAVAAPVLGYLAGRMGLSIFRRYCRATEVDKDSSFSSASDVMSDFRPRFE